MSLCLAGVILMENGWKKLGISHGCRKRTRIQTKRSVLPARKAWTKTLV